MDTGSTLNQQAPPTLASESSSSDAGSKSRDRAARHDDGIVGESPSLRTALDQLDRVAPTDTTVLLTGETGTGKELMARVLHRRSRRAGRGLVAGNLCANPEPLGASVPFGTEQGDFKGGMQPPGRDFGRRGRWHT